MTARTKVIIVLCLAGLVDTVLPFPVLAVVCLYVVATRPQWFRNLVRRVYAGD